MRKMKRPKISVCVPVYNAEKYLGECLESLVRQTLKEIEIVCVDDGSSDGSPKILDSYAKKYRNIKVIHQKNAGLGGARDAGIENASGEYIGFVDADDVVDEKMYEVLYNLAIAHSTEIAYCNLDLFPEPVRTKKRIWFNPYVGKVDGDFLYRNTQPTNKIFSRELFGRLGARFGRNDSVCITLMIEANGLCSTDEVLYHYRVGHASMSNAFKIDDFADTVKSISEIREYVRNKKEADADLMEYFDFLMIDAVIKILAVAIVNNDKSVYVEFRKQFGNYGGRCNKYCKKMFVMDYGRLKSFAMMNILPKSYYLSKLLIDIVLRKKLR